MKIALRLVLKWLASLPWGDFLRIAAQVPEVAKALPYQLPTQNVGVSHEERRKVNAARASMLREWIALQFPNLTGVNFVLEVAVRYFKFRQS